MVAPMYETAGAFPIENSVLLVRSLREWSFFHFLNSFPDNRGKQRLLAKDFNRYREPRSLQHRARRPNVQSKRAALDLFDFRDFRISVFVRPGRHDEFPVRLFVPIAASRNARVVYIILWWSSYWFRISWFPTSRLTATKQQINSQTLLHSALKLNFTTHPEALDIVNLKLLIRGRNSGAKFLLQIN